MELSHQEEERAQAEVSEQSDEPQVSQVETKPVRRGRLVGALVAVLVVIIAGVGFFLWQRNARNANHESVKVVVSLPLNLSVGEEIMNSVQLAFEEVSYRAGDVIVDVVPLDDGNEAGAWEADLEGRNAKIAADDDDVVAFIGPYNSGAAKVSMPILNRAGIVQVSPGNTWPGLTKEGFLPGEPGKFYPTGIRHYVRVVTTDDLQGPAGAVWAEELGFRTVYIIDDGEAYGKGIADLFRARAELLGMNVLKQNTIDKISTDFSLEVSDIKRLNPDLVYYGGTTANGGTHLLSQMRAAGIDSAFMGPDAILESDFILRTGRDDAEGVYATTVGALPLTIGTPEARRYHDAYVRRYGEEPGVFGPFGYEAARVVIAAIERASVKNRAEILRETKRTVDFEGLFGEWSFGVKGDTTFKLMSGNVVRDGVFEHVKTLRVP